MGTLERSSQSNSGVLHQRSEGVGIVMQNIRMQYLQISQNLFYNFLSNQIDVGIVQIKKTWLKLPKHMEMKSQLEG